MSILLNEMPGERCLFLESDEFSFDSVKQAQNRHRITAVLFESTNIGGAFLRKIKNSGLKTGLLINSLNVSELRRLIAKNYFDFVAINVKGTAGLKEAVGLLRASGTRYEVRADATELNQRVLEEAYEFCKPCNSFVVYNPPSLDFFSAFAKDKKNIVLRHMS